MRLARQPATWRQVVRAARAAAPIDGNRAPRSCAADRSARAEHTRARHRRRAAPCARREKMNLARVVCRQLGFLSASFQSEREGEGEVDETAPYQCNSGSEQELKQCKEQPSALHGEECTSALVVGCKTGGEFYGPAEPRCGSAGVHGKPRPQPGP